jgi:hypothetical protein
MPSAIEIPNHHYHIIEHNLQETNIRKEKQIIHKTFPPFSINYHNFCHLSLSIVNSIITSNLGFIYPNWGKIFAKGKLSYTYTRKNWPTFYQTQFFLKKHLYMIPWFDCHMP